METETVVEARNETRSAAQLRAALPRSGLNNFWYPAAMSNTVGAKLRAIPMLGTEVVLFRENGKVTALHNRCPHRGMPLSEGKRRFPGTLSCLYHGWTFDARGECVAALNEGPSSSLPGRVRVRSFPIQERNGVVWIWMGEGPATPIENDVPAELLDETQVLFCHTQMWKCNWLPAMENLLDTHDIFVHRESLFYLFRKLPSWAKVKADLMEDGKGVAYGFAQVGPLQDTYPDIGRWPPKVWWRRLEMPVPNPGEYFSAELRLPAVVRVGFSSLMYTRFMVPVGDDQVRAFIFSTRRVSGLRALGYYLYYKIWASWSLMKYFIDQDVVVFEKQDYAAPERLSITDVGLVKWRRIVADFARREQKAPQRETQAQPLAANAESHALHT